MKTRSARALQFLVVFLLLAGLLPTAGYGQAQAADSPLTGTSWVLSTLNGMLPLPGTSITLNFDAAKASGSNGCNSYSLGYTTHGSTIKFSNPAATTLMACPQPIMDQANAYMAALAAADSYAVRNSQLTLLAKNKVIATFVAAKQDPAGTTWLVTGYNNGRQAVVSPLVGADIIVNFDTSNEISGNAGCNDFFTLFQASNGNVSIDPVGSTRRMCTSPAGVMEQEQQFFAALASATTYNVQGDMIELRNADDAIAVQMVREQEISLPAPPPAVPTGRVTAPNGVNVRSGPGTNYPVLGVAPFGAEGEIIGRSADRQWWVVKAPAAPGGSAWVSADFVIAWNAENVPIIAAPPPPVIVPAPTPIPQPTPIPPPTATPAPQMSFSATPTTINQGQCATLQWSVENVQAVWVYPQGQPYQQYPRTGQGSEQVCPAVTTTYEMRVLLRDGTVTIQRVTVTVVPAPVQNPLNGTAWQVTGYNNGRNAVASPLAGSTLTMRFNASQITGQAGCNDYSGGYSVSGSNISIGQLASGMKACAEPAGVMEQEQEFLAALRSSTTFRFDGNRLELRWADGSLGVTATRLQ